MKLMKTIFTRHNIVQTVTAVIALSLCVFFVFGTIVESVEEHKMTKTDQIHIDGDKFYNGYPEGIAKEDVEIDYYVSVPKPLIKILVERFEEAFRHRNLPEEFREDQPFTQ